MCNQIFKKTIPNQLVIDLLEKICLREETYFIIDFNAYKKMLFHGYYTDFIENIRNYYYMSKQFYIDRKVSYNSFVNIIRQICKFNRVEYSSKIKYNESKYIIEYYIYL